MKTSPWPMLATLFRIFLVPLIIVLMMAEVSYWNWLCAFLFILASITDWLDGYLARKLNSVSTMGKFLDPVADKILISSVLIMLIPIGRIEAIAVLVLINRDVIIGGLRSIAASKGEVIAAGSLGKWKTAVQMVAIPCLLISEVFLFVPLATIGYWGVWLSLVLSVVSGFQYLVAFWNQSSNAIA
ncbi:MAG: CDP-diacylglycerol--glycerol-3-phosphate 3-phosphatidyltransferase [Bdellovibrionales bacterium]|nr:CDP-diacylglycerol--glycerol-3-phosphate 3-phosphatidyltransferase [Bdellovibrionales bacterium]